MIKMGEITCRIPSNGIKPEILYCTEPQGYRLDIWVAGSNLATAVITGLLFLVALGALTVARRTLNQMKADSEAQWEAVGVQLERQAELARESADANRQLSREQQQMQALDNFISAIRDVKVNAMDPKYDMVAGTSHLAIKWAAWSKFLPRGDTSFMELTGIATLDISKLAAFAHKTTQQCLKGEMSEDEFKEALGPYNKLIGSFIGNLNGWQGSDKERPAFEEAIRENFLEARRAYPTVLIKEPA